MKLVIGSDHGGVEMKDFLREKLKEAGHEVIDVGTQGSTSVDYPDIAFAAADKVVSGEVERGILVCGTGIGMSIAANKVKGIFCAKVNSESEGGLASEHNLTNMIALGGRTTEKAVAWKIVQAWLTTPRGGERHQRRVQKIADRDC